MHTVNRNAVQSLASMKTGSDMGNVIQLVGPHQVVQLFGVKLVGVNVENAKKLLFSIVFVACVMLLGRFLRWLGYRNKWDTGGKRFAFWTHQGISIALAIIFVIGLVSIWFNNPTTLTTAAGMVTAGLAFALQKVVTAFAGYLVILRGKIAELGEEALHALEERYVMKRSELKPQAYWGLTDNWIEMSVRFLVPDTGIRQIKSEMSRHILDEFDRAGIGIASGTYEVVGMPPIKVQMVSGNGAATGDGAKAVTRSSPA
jgi:hypothetical protein